MTTRKCDLPMIPFAAREAWETWLEIAGKGSGRETVSLAEALDVALCYGWISGRRSTASR